MMDRYKILAQSIRKMSPVMVTGQVEAIDPYGVRVRMPLCKPGMVLQDSDGQRYMVTSCQGMQAFAVPLDEGCRPVSGLRLKLKSWELSYPLFNDPWGLVIDSQGYLLLGSKQPTVLGYVDVEKISLADKRSIQYMLPTGVKAIDAFMTLGRGQRVAIMAGSGVGKTTLLGQLVVHTQADVKILCLIGERGREVVDFYHKFIEGSNNQVIVIAETSDALPIRRIQALEYSIALGQFYAQQGHHVALFVDSLTRYAMALRQTHSETPHSNTYPAFVFQGIADLVERFGVLKSGGSLTGVFTVLVEQDDLLNPLVDHIRAVVDGHWVLSRQLAQKQHYPAIDILASISRIQDQIVDYQHLSDSMKLKNAVALYRDYEEMITLGLYKKGQSPQLDLILSIWPEIERFLRQQPGEFVEYHQTLDQLKSLSQKLPDELYI